MNDKCKNLKIRSLKFSKKVIFLTQSLRYTPANKVISQQIIRSSSSIGANYYESREGISMKDSNSKIFISRKECSETRFWLELLKEINPDKYKEIDILIDEDIQLSKILYTITKIISKKEVQNTRF